jgi:hypothetical protein
MTESTTLPAGIVDYVSSEPGLLSAVGALVAGVGGLLGAALMLSFGWRPTQTSEA